MDMTNRNNTVGGDVRLEPVSRYDCWQLVTKAAGPDGIARVVWSGPDGPAIVPMNFTVADGFLWFQTGTNSRVALEACGHRVLVEIDHVDAASHTGWSVVVSGLATGLPPAKDPGLLSSLQVWPRGSRGLLVRVEPEEVNGRRLLRG